MSCRVACVVRVVSLLITRNTRTGKLFDNVEEESGEELDEGDPPTYYTHGLRGEDSQEFLDKLTERIPGVSFTPHACGVCRVCRVVLLTFSRVSRACGLQRSATAGAPSL